MSDVTIGRYLMLSHLHRGEATDIYRARVDGAFGFEKLVAIKRLSLEHAQDEAIRRRFIRQAVLGSKLCHHNVVGIYDFHEDGDELYLAMELVDCVSLKTILEHQRRTGQPFPLQAVLTIAFQLLDGLEYLHKVREPGTGRRLEFVHRDLSPANVLVDRSGVVKLTGLDRAQVRDEAEVLDPSERISPYAPPEVLEGAHEDATSDLYAVGALMFEMLTLEPLLTGAGASELQAELARLDLEARLEAVPAPSPALKQVLRKAMAARPGDRFQTAAAMSRDLRPILWEVSSGQSPDQLIREAVESARMVNEEHPHRAWDGDASAGVMIDVSNGWSPWGANSARPFSIEQDYLHGDLEPDDDFDDDEEFDEELDELELEEDPGFGGDGRKRRGGTRTVNLAIEPWAHLSPPLEELGGDLQESSEPLKSVIPAGVATDLYDALAAAGRSGPAESASEEQMALELMETQADVAFADALALLGVDAGNESAASIETTDSGLRDLQEVGWDASDPFEPLDLAGFRSATPNTVELNAREAIAAALAEEADFVWETPDTAASEPLGPREDTAPLPPPPFLDETGKAVVPSADRPDWAAPPVNGLTTFELPLGLLSAPVPPPGRVFEDTTASPSPVELRLETFEAPLLSESPPPMTEQEGPSAPPALEAFLGPSQPLRDSSSDPSHPRFVEGEDLSWTRTAAPRTRPTVPILVPEGGMSLEENGAELTTQSNIGDLARQMFMGENGGQEATDEVSIELIEEHSGEMLLEGTLNEEELPVAVPASLASPVWRRASAVMPTSSASTEAAATSATSASTASIPTIDTSRVNTSTVDTSEVNTSTVTTPSADRFGARAALYLPEEAPTEIQFEPGVATARGLPVRTQSIVAQSAASSTGLAFLLLSPNPGMRLAIPENGMTIGRAHSNDLVLADLDVAPRHARVVWEGGRWWLRAQRGEALKIDGHVASEAPLEPGHVLEIGHTRFTVVTNEPETPVGIVDYRALEAELISRFPNTAREESFRAAAGLTMSVELVGAAPRALWSDALNRLRSSPDPRPLRRLLDVLVELEPDSPEVHRARDCLRAIERWS